MKKGQLYKNLRALEDSAYPKECEKCGLVYENERDYIDRTIAFHKAPNFTESVDENGKTYLKLIRQCHCGAPILDHFGDRRDMSEKGELRRKAFEKVIQSLLEHGLSRKDARKELLNHLNHQKSPILEKLGILNR